MRNNIFKALILSLLLAGCVSNQPETGATADPSSQGLKEEQVERQQKLAPYRINVGDVLEVWVWRAKGLDDPREIIVRPDGVVSYPLVGDIRAAGLTLTDFDRSLTHALRKYIRHPEVSVAIRRFGGTKVIVIGEVARSGVYAPTGKGSVLEVIALAGGFTPTAVRRSVLVIRGGLANPKPMKLNLARALAKGDYSQNISLMPNDIVYVPKKFSATFNYYMKQITPTLQNLLFGTTVARDLGFIPYYGNWQE